MSYIDIIFINYSINDVIIFFYRARYLKKKCFVYQIILTKIHFL